MPKAANAERVSPLSTLKALVEYDAETGHIIWRVDRPSYGGKAKRGTRAGTVDRFGYLMIVIEGLVYPAHRLGWYLSRGYWPTKQIDHINMDPLDNRLSNLREASMTEQRANQKVRADSKSGIKGVSITQKGHYRARIKGTHLGTFADPESASAAYYKAAQKMFGEYARHR